MTEANFRLASDVYDGWRDDILTGKQPTLYPVGVGDFERIEIGPNLVTLIGGAPGAGKTAFTMQLMIEALRLTSDLRVCVCNIEMPPSVLLDRQLSRLSGIPATTIRKRRLDESHADRLDAGLQILDGISDRLCFVRQPYDLSNVAASADDFGADVIVLDYIQRIPAPGKHDDKRGSVDASMSYLRQFAEAGVAVIVVAAVGRAKDSRGRSGYDGDNLNLASFRESSELEFGADDAYILAPAGDDVVRLKHLKSRHGECVDFVLDFHKTTQRFDVSPPPMSNESRKLQSALQEMWGDA